MSMTRSPRVVVGVDDSLSGLEALRFAAAEARRRGVTLRAVRAWQFAVPWHEHDAGQIRAGMVDAAAMVLCGAFQQAMGGLPEDIDVEALAVEGPPARTLVDQAFGEYDLLVVGRPRPVRGWWTAWAGLGAVWPASLGQMSTVYGSRPARSSRSAHRRWLGRAPGAWPAMWSAPPRHSSVTRPRAARHGRPSSMVPGLGGPR
jgi:nucleotide-binding universal stress UspA family protein